MYRTGYRNGRGLCACVCGCNFERHPKHSSEALLKMTKKKPKPKKPKFKPIDQCKTLVELFADSSRWTQRTLARDKKGLAVSHRSKEAVCFCLVGGAYRVYGGRNLQSSTLLKIESENQQQQTVGSFNDDNSYETVYNLLKKLNV